MKLWHWAVYVEMEKVVCLSTCKGAWLRSEKRFPFSHRKNYPKYRPLTSWAWDLGGEKNLYLFSRSSSKSPLSRYCHHDHNMIIVLNVFRSCYLNQLFCKFSIYLVSTIDLLGPGHLHDQHPDFCLILSMLVMRS